MASYKDMFASGLYYPWLFAGGLFRGRGMADYSDDGRQPIGIVQRMGHEYPLVAPSYDIRYLLADAYLNYEDPSDYDTAVTEFALPFSIKWLYGIGILPIAPPPWAPIPTHAADILIVDANGRTVFDSTQATTYLYDQWCIRLDVHEWRSDTTAFRLVVHTKWEHNYITPHEYSNNLVPSSAVLDERTIDRQPKRLKSIIVGLTRIAEGIVELHAGYNTELIHKGSFAATAPLSFVGGRVTAGNNGLRSGQQIELAAVPGTGLGRFPGCGDIDIALRTINGVAGNEYGDWLLIPEACYWYERPSTVVRLGNYYRNRLVSVTPHTLQLHNNCTPCCDCQDFVEVMLAISAQYLEWRDIAREAEQARDVYRENKSRWMTQKQCRETQPQRLTVEAHCSGYVSAGYSFCNNSLDCMGPLDVTFTIKTYGFDYGNMASETDLDIQIVPNRTRKNDGTSRRLENYTLGGAYPVYTAHWDALDSRTPGLLKFMLRGCDAVDGSSLEISATATFAGEDYDAVTELVSFEGDCDSPEVCGSIGS